MRVNVGSECGQHGLQSSIQHLFKSGQISHLSNKYHYQIRYFNNDGISITIA